MKRLNCVWSLIHLHQLHSLIDTIVNKTNHLGLSLLLENCLLLSILLHHQHLLWVNWWHVHSHHSHVLLLLVLILVSSRTLVLTTISTIVLIKTSSIGWLWHLFVVVWLLLNSTCHLHWIELLDHLSWRHLLHHHVLVVVLILKLVLRHKLLLIWATIIVLILVAAVISIRLSWRSLS